jgi:hypothetical protein
MPLDKCPHMAARCPHKEPRCHDSDSKQCHYITTATASALSSIAALRALGVEQLSEVQREHFNSMEELIASLEEPPDPPM